MNYFLEQLRLHPSMQVEDAAKFCFQATFGAEHLLADAQRAKIYLYQELEDTPIREEALFENISDQYCRVNLAAWKMHGFPKEMLFDLFYETAKTKNNATAQDLETKLQEITILSENAPLSFSASDWKTFLTSYNRMALHHSDVYRRVERPAYRLILRQLLNVSALYR